jgi:putative DNA primase/helicase
MEAAYIVAARNIYHPVRDYLNTIIWDGHKRLDTWLTKYCNVVDEEYSRAIGRKTLVAAVTRAFKPGCEFHHVLVLEGAQGIGKSRAVAALGGEWFSDFHIDPANKDTVDAMRGKWIIEIPEMESIRGNKDMQLLKAFITRNEDRVRLAYARNTKDLPRRGIFIGTFNPDGIGYLTDSTGNRRFWPVLCTKTVDVEGIRRNRDQLFAEAVAAYKNGEPIHIEDEKLRKEAEAQAEDRVEIDPWVEVIMHWASAAGKEVQTVSTADVFELVLHGTIKNITRVDQIRIGKALTLAGWHKKRAAHGFLYHRRPQEPDQQPNPVPADVFAFRVLP